MGLDNCPSGTSHLSLVGCVVSKMIAAYLCPERVLCEVSRFSPLGQAIEERDMDDGE